MSIKGKNDNVMNDREKYKTNHLPYRLMALAKPLDSAESVNIAPVSKSLNLQ